MLARGTTRPVPARPAFTLIEIMFSILVIGVLLALLIGGVRFATQSAKSTVQRQAVASIMTGAIKFQSEFGFPLPLVKDRHPTPADRKSVEVGPGGQRRAAVYPHNPDLASPDGLALRGQSLTPAPNNPFGDYRFSERTLPYYLGGACGTQLTPSGAGSTIPFDGRVGPGMYKPERGGSFDIPRDVIKDPDPANPSRRIGTVYEPFVDVGKSALKLYTNPTPPPGEGDTAADPDNLRAVELRDTNEVPIRYYRWEQEPTAANRTLQDLNIPAMVGRELNVTGRTPQIIPTPPDRDLSVNVKLRGATFAIVAAGPNRVFGDEPIDDLRQRLGVGGSMDELQVRFEAEKDNIVEVGGSGK